MRERRVECEVRKIIKGRKEEETKGKEKDEGKWRKRRIRTGPKIGMERGLKRGKEAASESEGQEEGGKEVNRRNKRWKKGREREK